MDWLGVSSGRGEEGAGGNAVSSAVPGRGNRESDSSIPLRRKRQALFQLMAGNKETIFCQSCDAEHGPQILEAGLLGQDEREQWESAP